MDGYVMRSQNSTIRTVLKQNPVGKRPLGKPKLRWELGRYSLEGCRRIRKWIKLEGFGNG